jgi:hypothetical protein
MLFARFSVTRPPSTSSAPASSASLHTERVVNMKAVSDDDVTRVCDDLQRRLSAHTVSNVMDACSRARGLNDIDDVVSTVCSAVTASCELFPHSTSGLSSSTVDTRYKSKLIVRAELAESVLLKAKQYAQQQHRIHHQLHARACAAAASATRSASATRTPSVHAAVSSNASLAVHAHSGWSDRSRWKQLFSKIIFYRSETPYVWPSVEHDYANWLAQYRHERTLIRQEKKKERIRIRRQHSDACKRQRFDDNTFAAVNSMLLAGVRSNFIASDATNQRDPTSSSITAIVHPHTNTLTTDPDTIKSAFSNHFEMCSRSRQSRQRERTHSARIC